MIRSLNNDKPYDQFVREQLAGDEIAASLGLNANSPTDKERTRYAELITATGFLRMAPDGTASKNTVETRNQCVADTIKILSTTLYGVTIECAQCHNHRYDPITQADYYRLRAVFDPGFDVGRWRVPRSRLVSLQTKQQAQRAADIEVEAKKIDAERTAKQTQFIAEVLEKELAKREESLRADLKTAYNTPAKERTAEQKKLLAGHPSINNLSPGSLYLYDSTYKTKHAETLKKIAERAQAIRATKPVEEFVHAFVELARDRDAVAASHSLFPRQPGVTERESLAGGSVRVGELASGRTPRVFRVRANDGPASGVREINHRWKASALCTRDCQPHLDASLRSRVGSERQRLWGAGAASESSGVVGLARVAIRSIGLEFESTSSSDFDEPNLEAVFTPIRGWRKDRSGQPASCSTKQSTVGSGGFAGRASRGDGQAEPQAVRASGSRDADNGRFDRDRQRHYRQRRPTNRQVHPASR